MKKVRLLALVLVMALTFTVTGGGFAPEAEAQFCEGTFSCTSDYQCFYICCSRYPCDPNYPPFCDFFNGTSTCGVCFC
jgi:hypothetical protein